MSLVLVVIGLIVGGILVGRDLISAANARAQIAQIEKYNQAVNTFYGKYGALPGDMPATPAALFGFAARGQYEGEGDGNGVIEGNGSNSSASVMPWGSNVGETVMFWVDLSQAKLIDGSFTVGTSNVTIGYGIVPQAPPTIPNYLASYLPQAKIAYNYVYAYSFQTWNGSNYVPTGLNYFAVENITQLAAGGPAAVPGTPVSQAFSIDKKIDDGLPTTGRIIASYVNGQSDYYEWANGVWNKGFADNLAYAQTTTTCYDNGGSSGATVMQYSIGPLASGGAGTNCALSFQMQGAAR